MKKSKNMFELICMSLLGAAYIYACKEEAAEEKRQEEKGIRDLKISVFCYAARHHLNYNDVVKMIQDKKLTFDDIERDRKEHEGK